MAKSKKVAGATVSPMSIQEAVQKAIKPVLLEVSKLEAEMRGAQGEAAGLRRELETVRPLLVDAQAALVWATAHPDYCTSGKYHDGFLGTAAPVMKRLEAFLSPSKPAVEPHPEGGAGDQPNAQGDGGEDEAHAP
jgi:hypothetical protein